LPLGRSAAVSVSILHQNFHKGKIKSNLLAGFIIYGIEEKEEVNTQDLALAGGLEIRDNARMARPKDDNTALVMGGANQDALAELIARGRAGDSLALEAIYGRYKIALFNLAYRYTFDRVAAEDLLQEIFIKIFTHLDDVKTAETFTGWVYKIALNTCYSYLRGRRNEIEKSVPLAAVEGVLHDGAKDAPRRDFRKPLDEAIGALPLKLKEIFLLHDVEGFKHGEIARMLGLSVGTSKSQLFKARIRVRDFLKKKGIS
jgi:RNA polymerase sigma-70 factor (ECF subfamily)